MKVAERMVRSGSNPDWRGGHHCGAARNAATNKVLEGL